MTARILLAVGVLVHAGSVAALVAALLLGGGWRPIGAALVGIVAAAVWVLAIREHIDEQEVREQAAEVAPVPIRPRAA